mmetsp:Transcript_29840/g.97178  ORF Transcript_29840/g.97178 Transcript_29840/m.97178 type:complete len:284 (-) Transcript_29840:63-914(-)
MAVAERAHSEGGAPDRAVLAERRVLEFPARGAHVHARPVLPSPGAGAEGVRAAPVAPVHGLERAFGGARRDPPQRLRQLVEDVCGSRGGGRRAGGAQDYGPRREPQRSGSGARGRGARPPRERGHRRHAHDVGARGAARVRRPRAGDAGPLLLERARGGAARRLRRQARGDGGGGARGGRRARTPAHCRGGGWGGGGDGGDGREGTAETGAWEARPRRRRPRRVHGVRRRPSRRPRVRAAGAPRPNLPRRLPRKRHAQTRDAHALPPRNLRTLKILSSPVPSF